MIAQIETGKAADSGPYQVRGDAARHRAALYAVLAQALSAPGRALCDAVEQNILPVVIEQALHRQPLSYVRDLDLGFLGKLTAPAGCGVFEDMLMAEYTRLFALNMHCPQYEADYVSRNSFNWAHVISAVTGMYSNFGVQLASGVGERPDHIAVELDFMNLLAAKEAHARELNHPGRTRLSRRAQKLFFASHLSRWAVAFARKLGEETRLDFYKGVAGFTETLMIAEARYWSVGLQTPEFQADSAATGHPGAKATTCGCSEGVQQPEALAQLVPQTQVPVQQIAGGKE